MLNPSGNVVRRAVGEGLFVRAKWIIGVWFLALALSSGVAVAQTPAPDPAPVPAPAPPPAEEPVIEPTPEPEPAAEASPKPRQTKEAPPTKPRPERPLALRLARLHPPFTEAGPPTERRARRAPDLVPLSDVRSTESGSRPVPLRFALLAFAGICVLLVGLLAAPERLTGGASQQLAAHREHVAVGGFAVLLGLAIGVSIPLLLQ